MSAGLQPSLDRLFDAAGHEPALEKGIDHLVAAGSVSSLQAWWSALLLDGRAPLQERVTLMWHDHFATSNDKVRDVRLMLRQNRILRELGMGDFRVLLHEVARDPAMLVWLDGNLNKRGQPNENFAREVMELFGLGIGSYDESDIREAARAFTGWGTRGRAFHYRAADHDPGTKEIFGHLGTFGGDEVIDLILAHPACARHIARRLLWEFVSEAPEPSLVEPLAAFLVANDWNIGRCVRHIFESEAFFAEIHRRTKISGPVEFVVSSCRLTGVAVAPQAAATALDQMGQSLFRPPSVKGWDGGRSWINAGTWLARHNFGIEEAIQLDTGELDRRLGEPASAELAGALLDYFLPQGSEPSFQAILAEALGQTDQREVALRHGSSLILTSPQYHLV